MSTPTPTPTSTSTLSARIAHLALWTFTGLPEKSKPRSHEWTPLSAIILSSSSANNNNSLEPELLTCISIATGTKCLPATSLPRCNGTVLHDCHAEILALRGLNRWLLAEIERVLTQDGYQSRWIEYQSQYQAEAQAASSSLSSVINPPEVSKPFTLRPEVSIHLFSTEAPCGDASMGLLISSTAQTHGDATAWPEPESKPKSVSIVTSDLMPESDTPTSTSTSTSSSPPVPLHGRGYFSLLGLVRRKPSRSDAEPTLSKSCTDKLTLKQATSALAWPVSLFVQRTGNAFLKSLVLPAEKFDEVAFGRAFGRLGKGDGDGDGDGKGGVKGRKDLSVRKLDVFTFSSESDDASLTFPFSKPPFTPPSLFSLPSKASNLSALWVAGGRPSPSPSPALNGEAPSPLINETLVNSVKQGSKQWGEQTFKMSGVCRRRMWDAGQRVDNLLKQRDCVGVGLERDGAYRTLPKGETYAAAKRDVRDTERRAAKEEAMEVLGGWVRNQGDDEWAFG